MARFTESLLAKRDDPIYREGLTISTPISDCPDTWGCASAPPLMRGAAFPLGPGGGVVYNNGQCRRIAYTAGAGFVCRLLA